VGTRTVVLILVLFSAKWAISQSNDQKPGAEAGLKVFISADMEGIGGVVSAVQTSPKDRQYGQFSKLMTMEVNAAIDGAFEAGASEVLVADAHGDSQNIDVELLDKRAKLVRGMPRPLGMMEGIDKSFAAVVFIGYHAAAQRGDAILSHTNSGKIWDVRLNGVSLPEAGFNAAIAGDLGIPVVFISGDQTICSDATKLFGPLEVAVTKQAIGWFSGVTIHPEQSRALIHAGVKRGIERRRELRPYRLEKPLNVEVTFKDEIQAEVAAYLPIIHRVNGNTVSYTAQDAFEAHRIYRAISKIDPF